MTARDLYQNALIEINKLEAPSLLLDDYNYLINKAVQQYINKVYNRYEINQQATDDLRVLKTSARIKIEEGTHDEWIEEEEINVPNYAVPDELKEYYCKLPEDYLHLLNCVVSYGVNPDYKPTKKCEVIDEAGKSIWYPARKMTADIEPSVLINAYLKPDYKRPYYYINNVETYDTRSEELDELYIITHAEEFGELTPKERAEELQKKYPNSGIRMQIRCGSSGKYIPAYAFINYIRKPKPIILTYAELDGVDHSPKLEFPDYVCYEIINEFTKLLLENASDARLQTHLPINQSIATTKDSK